MRHSQTYRWVSQPRQFPGQQLGRVAPCDRPQTWTPADTRPNLFQASLQTLVDLFKASDLKRNSHSWE